MRDLHLPGRSVAMGHRGAAATSHPLSTAVAIETMRHGGNAIDAAVTACILQSVLEPHNTGLGGDCFALVWKAKERRLYALNGAGYAPERLSDAWLLSQGAHAIGSEDIHAVTIPGAVDAWQRLLSDHGTTSWAGAFEPAIDYAERGFVLAERAAVDWAAQTGKLHRDPGGRAHLLDASGRAPRAGDLVRLPALARTMRRIVQSGADDFYRGELAGTLVASLNALGGRHTRADFADYASFYVDPIYTAYRGVELAQIPPSGHGLTVLVMLNILALFDHQGLDPVGADRFHLQCEASRLAYRMRDTFVADPAFAHVPVDELLSAGFARDLAAKIRQDRTLPDDFALPALAQRDTVYLSVIDGEGNACSLISSLFFAFGSGQVCPQTGITFQNRGAGFRVQPGHPNSVQPRKRPLHTIIPSMAMQDGRPLLCFGVMGGAYQPVGVVNVLQNIVDFSMDVQEALDAPRGFRYTGPFEAERGITQATLQELALKGQPVARSSVPFGGGQLIAIDPVTGVLSAGSDPRKDGAAIAY
ncbi:MAG: gamma-glutamyltransferase family protein [Variovorax sp.]